MLDGLTVAFRNARNVAQKARRISDEHQRKYRDADRGDRTIDKRGEDLKRVASEAGVKLEVAERAMRAAVAVKRRNEVNAADAGLQSQLRAETQARRDAAAASKPVSLRRGRRSP
jgi:septum formation inhibitor MinC